MTITSAICNSFKVEILQGGHNFNDASGAPTGNAYKLALSHLKIKLTYMRYLLVHH